MSDDTPTFLYVDLSSERPGLSPQFDKIKSFTSHDKPQGSREEYVRVSVIESVFGINCADLKTDASGT